MAKPLVIQMRFYSALKIDPPSDAGAFLRLSRACTEPPACMRCSDQRYLSTDRLGAGRNERRTRCICQQKERCPKKTDSKIMPHCDCADGPPDTYVDSDSDS